MFHNFFFFSQPHTLQVLAGCLAYPTMDKGHHTQTGDLARQGRSVQLHATKHLH